MRFGTATGVMDSAGGAPPEKLTHHSRCATREARGSRRPTGEAQVQGSRRTAEEAHQNFGAIGGGRASGTAVAA